MASSVTHDSVRSTAAARRFSRKRLRPGKVRAKTSRLSVSSGRPIVTPTQAFAAASVITVMAGSRNAATSEVTDWGAL